jgi:hypothetical protein
LKRVGIIDQSGSLVRRGDGETLPQALSDERQDFGRDRQLLARDREDLWLVGGVMRDDHQGGGSAGLEIELDAPEALVSDGEPNVVGIVHQEPRIGHAKLGPERFQPESHALARLEQVQDGMVYRFIA